jgi:hypothetical protein
MQVLTEIIVAYYFLCFLTSGITVSKLIVTRGGEGCVDRGDHIRQGVI